MSTHLFQTPEYRTIMEEHISKTIGYLFEKNQEFIIACQVKHTHFMPELPDEIKKSFKETVLFIIAGYTYQSSKLKEGYFSFEAGFGHDNFGSIVSIPLLAIKQVFVEEDPILLNYADVAPKLQEANRISQQNSMNALLNNPKNKKLLRKNREEL